MVKKLLTFRKKTYLDFRKNLNLWCLAGFLKRFLDICSLAYLWAAAPMYLVASLISMLSKTYYNETFYENSGRLLGNIHFLENGTSWLFDRDVHTPLVIYFLPWARFALVFMNPQFRSTWGLCPSFRSSVRAFSWKLIVSFFKIFVWYQEPILSCVWRLDFKKNLFGP